MTPHNRFASLLPAVDESPRCSPFTRELGVNPAGTGVRADRVILIEAPLPWPMPVRDHRFLAGLMPMLDEADRASRIFAAVPTGTAETVRVVVFERRGGSADRQAYRVASAAALPSLVHDLLSGGVAAAEFAIDEDAPDQALLICTQGSHDVCCGSFGTRLAVEAKAAFGEVEVFRVSHTGGHRFAPTAMTLPDGRMWAYLDIDRLAAIFDRTGDPAALARFGRGWWGADRGPAQVAEQAVFAEQGWAFVDCDRSVTVTASDSDVREQRTGCTVVSGGDVWDVEVAVAREVPTISCHSPGGLPAKPATEYVVASLESQR